MRRAVRSIAFFVGILAAAASAGTAQSSLISKWTTFSTGVGPAGATMKGDTVYEGSGQLLGLVGFARVISPRRAVEFSAVGGHSFQSGDCIPGFSVCAPPFSFVGASASLLTSVFGPVGPNRFLTGVGGGLFRVAPSEGNAVSPRPALGIQISAEAPMIVASQSALAIGLRGILLPGVHGQTLGVGLLTATLRTW